MYAGHVVKNWEKKSTVHAIIALPSYSLHDSVHDVDVLVIIGLAWCHLNQLVQMAVKRSPSEPQLLVIRIQPQRLLARCPNKRVTPELLFALRVGYTFPTVSKGRITVWCPNRTPSQWVRCIRLIHLPNIQGIRLETDKEL